MLLQLRLVLFSVALASISSTSCHADECDAALAPSDGGEEAGIVDVHVSLLQESLHVSSNKAPPGHPAHSVTHHRNIHLLAANNESVVDSRNLTDEQNINADPAVTWVEHVDGNLNEPTSKPTVKSSSPSPAPAPSSASIPWFMWFILILLVLLFCTLCIAVCCLRQKEVEVREVVKEVFVPQIQERQIAVPQVVERQVAVPEYVSVPEYVPVPEVITTSMPLPQVQQAGTVLGTTALIGPTSISTPFSTGSLRAGVMPVQTSSLTANVSPMGSSVIRSTSPSSPFRSISRPGSLTLQQPVGSGSFQAPITTVL